MYLFAIGIGAGLVSALLFGVVITGSPLAMALSIIAPLPIFIAALGWNHRSGLVAAAAGSLALAASLTSAGGIAYGLGWALPAWGVAYLALLGRPGANGSMEWYPTGRLLLWIAGSAALITALGVFALGNGSYDAFQANVQRGFEGLLQDRSGPAADGEASRSEVISFLVDALPFIVAFNFVFVLTLNVWLAGKVVQISERLPRPWPAIAATVMPRLAIGLLVLAALACFLPDLPGAFGLAATGALVAAFTLQGLAFIHHTSRERPGRAFLLSTVYVLAFVMSSISLPLLALVGLADVAFVLRSRSGSGTAGPRSPST